MTPTSLDTDHCVSCFRLTMLALVVVMCVRASAVAAMPPAEIYSTAEKWFSSLETEQGLVPTAPVTLLTDGFYHRCYDNGICFGVSLDAQDGLTYEKEGDGGWEPLGTLDDLVASLPSVLVEEVGEIGGDLAADIEYEVEPVSRHSRRAHSMKIPMLLGEKKLKHGVRRRFRRAFKDGVPIAIVDADPREVKRLRKAVGFKGLVEVPEGMATLEAYGIDMDTEGNIYELMVLHPADLPQANVEVSSGDEATGATITTTHQEDATFVDSEPLQSIRTAELIEWLRDDDERDRTAAQRAAGGGGALARSLEQFQNLEDVVRSYESRMVFNFRKNVHALTTNVWTVHNRDLNEDWFYVRQQGLFSAANELLPLALVNNISSTEGNNRGRFTDLYNINTFVQGYSNNAAVFLDQTSPVTTTGVTRISSSVSWNLSGKLSANGKCDSSAKCEIGAGGEISGGVSVNNSYSYDIPDVNVRNQSGSNLNNASWDFAIAWPAWTDGLGCLGHSGLGPLAPVSGSTFQPVTQWIWRVGSKVRSSNRAGLPIVVQFKTRVRHIYYGAFCTWSQTNWFQESPVLAGTMVVPWPKK